MSSVAQPHESIRLGSGVVGGKAFALAEMLDAGFDVPPFVVVMPEAFAGGALSGIALSDVSAAVDALPGERFAVRSSGRMEDGAQDSHAGQFLTRLNVTRAEIATAAAEVVASGQSETVAAYRSARALAGVDLPAVVIQTMVEARAAGVAFAADPVSGRRDRVVLSATTGLGDRLVSGEDTGETWVLAQPTLEAIVKPIGAPVLTLDEAVAVARLCLAVTAARGTPQDIEWAYGPTGLLLLQARPITTSLLLSAAAETTLRVFDNSNIVESYPGIVSPLTFSFAVEAYARVYRAFLTLVGVDAAVIDTHAAELSNMLSLLDGRMYYNLGNWYRLLSLLPFFSSNRSHMESMMGVAEPLPNEIMTGAAEPPGAKAKFRMVIGLTLAAFRLGRTHRAFMARVADAIPPKTDRAALAALPLSRLAQEYRRIEAALLDRWDAPIVNDFLCMMAFGASRRLMERWGGEAGLAIHNDVMIGQGDIISAEPARLIREAGRLARTIPGAAEALVAMDPATAFALPGLGPLLSAYIEKFGDRRIGELKLEQPTLDDDPRSLFQAVLAAFTSHAGRADRSDPEEALAALFQGRPLRLALARHALAYAKARVRDRENLRFERTRIFGHARRVFLAIGRALAASNLLRRPDDVFFLTVAETLGAAEGAAVTANLAALVELRRTEYATFQNLADPPSRILIRGSICDRAARMSTGAATSSANDARERMGTACGGGIAMGRVRVIRDPLSEQLAPGEVLVARHTDPGWISHFAHASAVVVERGSVLSHSAIVSRELGIPCVVALSDACSWLATGELVSVDGSNGMVRKTDE